MIINLDLDKFFQALPLDLKHSLENTKEKTKLIEIVLDLGRRPEGRFLFGSKDLSESLVSWQDLNYISKNLGDFNQKNRVGINHSLHRISCIRNRDGIIVGLSCRIGRAVLGSIGIIRDLLESNESLLILGKPGLGKTTLIREISRILSDEYQKRVVIVDSSNEIGGNSDFSHPSTGRARRLQMPPSQNQQTMMIEAVENHMPQVIIVDEIGTELEAFAAQTIAERGVKLIGTAHGNSLLNLIKNPILCNLLGGLQSVTLSDEEARKRNTQKTISERKFIPSFSLAIELNEKNLWTVHENVETAVDSILKNHGLKAQRRFQKSKNLVKIKHLPKNPSLLVSSFLPQPSLSRKKKKKNLAFLEKAETLNESSLSFLNVQNEKDVPKKKKKQFKEKTKALKKKLFVYAPFFHFTSEFKLLNLLKTSFYGTKDLNKANFVFVSKLYLKQSPSLQKFAVENNLPIYFLKKHSFFEVNFLIHHLKNK